MTKKQALFLSVTVPLAWGTSYMFMKLGMTGVPAMTIVALRCGIAFLLTFAIFFKKAIRIDRKTMLHSAVTGALLFGVFLCLLYGVAGTSASAAGFLQSTTVIIVPILHAMISREPPAKQVIAGVITVTIGLFLLSGASLAGLNIGALCCLLSALLYAIHILLTKQFVADTDPLCLGIWQLGFAAIYALITTFLLEKPVLPQTAVQWIGILGLALICSAYGFVMQAVLQKYVSPETTGFMFSLEPVFSAIFAFLFLHERLHGLGYAGAVLIFVGVLIANTTGTSNISRNRRSNMSQEKINIERKTASKASETPQGNPCVPASQEDVRKDFVMVNGVLQTPLMP